MHLDQFAKNLTHFISANLLEAFFPVLTTKDLFKSDNS